MPKPRSINCDTGSTAGSANRSVKIEEPRRHYWRSKTGSRQPLAARGLFALAPFFQIRAMGAVSQRAIQYDFCLDGVTGVDSSTLETSWYDRSSIANCESTFDFI
jgi:hypothetical protein